MRRQGVLHRLCLVLKGNLSGAGFGEQEFSEGDGPPPSFAAAHSLLQAAAGGSLRSLFVGVQYSGHPAASFGIGSWVLTFPQLRFLEVDSIASQAPAGVACLSSLTSLQSLGVACRYDEAGGLGRRGQPPFLPPSLTNLDLTYCAFLPSLATATRLRRRAVYNISDDVFAHPLDVSGLEAATGLTALSPRSCSGLAFAPAAAAHQRPMRGSSGCSLVPLAALPVLAGLSLRGSIPECVDELPLSTTCKVSNVARPLQALSSCSLFCLPAALLLKAVLRSPPHPPTPTHTCAGRCWM